MCVLTLPTHSKLRWISICASFNRPNQATHALIRHYDGSRTQHPVLGAIGHRLMHHWNQQGRRTAGADVVYAHIFWPWSNRNNYQCQQIHALGGSQCRVERLQKKTKKQCSRSPVSQVDGCRHALQDLLRFVRCREERLRHRHRMDTLRQQIAARIQQRSRDHAHGGRTVPGLYILWLAQLHQHLRGGVEHLSEKKKKTTAGELLIKLCTEGIGIAP